MIRLMFNMIKFMFMIAFYPIAFSFMLMWWLIQVSIQLCYLLILLAVCCMFYIMSFAIKAVLYIFVIIIMLLGIPFALLSKGKHRETDYFREASIYNPMPSHTSETRLSSYSRNFLRIAKTQAISPVSLLFSNAARSSYSRVRAYHFQGPKTVHVTSYVRHQNGRRVRVRQHMRSRGR